MLTIDRFTKEHVLAVFRYTNLQSSARAIVHHRRPCSWNYATLDKEHTEDEPVLNSPVTQSVQNRPHKCRSPPTPAWKNVVRLHVFDSWLDLCCHIFLTPHIPVFVAIKTNKTLPRSGCPPSAFQKNSIKTKQWAVTAHYSYCSFLEGINHLV